MDFLIGLLIGYGLNSRQGTSTASQSSAHLFTPYTEWGNWTEEDEIQWQKDYGAKQGGLK